MWQGKVAKVERDGFDTKITIEYSNGAETITAVVGDIEGLEQHIANGVARLNSISEKVDIISTESKDSIVSIDNQGKVKVVDREGKIKVNIEPDALSEAVK